MKKENKVESKNKKGFHPTWEENVYSKGRQLNRYPHHYVVSFIYSKYAKVPNKSKVKILELGCGAGNNLWFAAREGFTVAGIDGSVSAIEFAKQRFKSEKLNCDFKVGDFSSLPWPDNHFDLVLDRGSLTCTSKETIESALNESKRILKKGGRLFSMIYSDSHPGKKYGVCIGKNTYDNFSGGYFFGLGTVHFCTRKEINEIYGERFNIDSVILMTEEDRKNIKPSIVNAIWKIEGTKK